MSRILELVLRGSLHENTCSSLDCISGNIHLVHIEGQRSVWLHINSHCPHLRHHILVAAIPFAENAELDGYRAYIRLAPLFKYVTLELGVSEALGEYSIIFQCPDAGIEVIAIYIDLGDIGRDIILRHLPCFRPFEGKRNCIQIISVQFYFPGRGCEFHRLVRLEEGLGPLKIVYWLLTCCQGHER